MENYKDAFPSLLKKQYGKKLQVSVCSKNGKVMSTQLTRALYATMFSTYTKQSPTIMIRNVCGITECL